MPDVLWEYKVIRMVAGLLNEAADILNQHGRDRWELVAVVKDDIDNKTEAVMYFKRQRLAKPLSAEEKKEYAAGPFDYRQPKDDD